MCWHTGLVFDWTVSKYITLSYSYYFWVAQMYLLPPNGEGYVSISVALSVCLSFCNMTDKLVCGFSWNFLDRSDMEQRTFSNTLGFTVSHLTGLFHIPQMRCGGGLCSRCAFCCICNMFSMVFSKIIFLLYSYSITQALNVLNDIIDNICMLIWLI